MATRNEGNFPHLRTAETSFIVIDDALTAEIPEEVEAEMAKTN